MEKTILVDHSFLSYVYTGDVKSLELAFKQKGAENKDDLIEWKWLSYGEKHILNSFCRIIRYIDDDSLMIDEPEISLHPSWQIQYIPLLYKVFHNYDRCQFIIASHSHFITTGLPKQKSFLLSLSKKNTNGRG